MDERVKLGFEFAKEIATQLITLSTGFLALTITFTKDLLAATPGATRNWLKGAWLFHVLSIICGVWSMLALTGTLMPLAADGKTLDMLTLELNVRLPALLQIASFVLGTLLMVIYALSGIRRMP